MTEIEIESVGEEPPLSIESIRSAALVAIADGVTDVAMISITFLPTDRIADLNETHFKKRAPTDVIAFGMTHDDALVGDIYICPAVARRHAAESGTSFDREILRLIIHGSLHVLGYTHPEDDARIDSEMWLKQEAYLRSLEEHDRES